MAAAAAAIVTDDDVVARRLLAREAVTAKKSANVKRCTSAYMQLLTACEGDDAAARDAAYEGLLAELALLKQAAAKSRRVEERCASEVALYKELHTKIDAQKSEAKEEIGTLKGRLEEERRIRRNKEEYETLARVINELAPREDLVAEQAKLDEERATLQKQSEATDAELQLRTKQFQLLLRSVYDLQKTLGEEDGGAASDEEGEVGDVEMR